MPQINTKALPNDFVDKYKVVNNSFRRVVRDNPSDRIVVEIGDVKQEDFKPQLKICRWGDSEKTNEVNFSMRAVEDPTATVETEGDVVKYKAKDYEVHQYEKPEAGEDGGYEFEWFLPARPNSNIFTTTIQSKGLDFFYQPALTQEEIDLGANQPENVIGSYAVYHKTKSGNLVGGMEYKAGKFCHIYRPEAVDAKGAKTWCDLSIDELAGVLTVTVPKEYLDNAVYPVIVDPTIGYSSAGASSIDFNNTIIGTQQTPAFDGRVVRMSAYMSSADSGNKSKCGLYYESATNTGTYAQYGSAEYTGTYSLAWREYLPATGETFPLVDDAYNWYVGIWGNSLTNIIYRDSGVSNDGMYNNALTYTGTWPTSTSFTDSSYKYSLYATYYVEGNTTDTTPVLEFTGTDVDGDSVTYQVQIDSADTFDSQSGSPILDKLSASDAGFANTITPADTDPFNSGERVSFTVQSGDALTAGSYYWRVRAKDPSGSNTWGAWSDARIFEVEDSGYDPLTANYGTFTLTGQSTTLKTARTLTAAQGSYTLTGQSATLTKAVSYTLTAAQGTFTLTGQAAGLAATRTLALAQGTFTLTGQDTALKTSRTLSLAHGSFAITGQDATITKTTALSLTAEAGSFSLSGQAVTLTTQRKVQADHGNYTITGQDAQTLTTRKLAAEYGSFSLTGYATGLVKTGSYSLTANTETFTFDGKDASLTASRILNTNVIGYGTIKNGILACYEMDETTGTTAYDASANGNNGTINGSPQLGITGKLDKAYNFGYLGTSTARFVALPDNAKIFGASDRTYTAWINPGTSSGARSIYGQGTSTAGGSIRWRLNDGGTTMSAAIYNLNSTGTVSITPGEWAFLFVQVQGSTFRVGKIVSGSMTDSSNSIGGALDIKPGNAYIGRSYLAQEAFDGLIDQFVVWNKALTDAELIEIENSGNGLAFSSWPEPSYQVTGVNVTFTIGYTLVAEHGSFAISDQSATLKTERTFTAEHGSFTLTGQDATFNETVSYTLSAGNGEFVLTGQDASITVSLSLTASYGSYTLTANDSNIARSILFIAGSGNYSLTGISISTSRTYLIFSDVGTFVATWKESGITTSRKLGSSYGSYTLSWYDIGVSFGTTLHCSVGNFIFNGYGATLTYVPMPRFNADSSFLTLIGNDARFIYSNYWQPTQKTSTSWTSIEESETSWTPVQGSETAWSAIQKSSM